MASQDPLELAKQGNIQAIDALLGRMLGPRGVAAKSVLNQGHLHVLLESETVPDQSTLVPFVHQAISRLGSTQFKSLTVYGRQRDQQGKPSWSQVVNLGSDEQPVSPAAPPVQPPMPPAPPPAPSSVSVEDTLDPISQLTAELNLPDSEAPDARDVLLESSVSPIPPAPLDMPASQPMGQFAHLPQELPEVVPPPPHLVQPPGDPSSFGSALVDNFPDNPGNVEGTFAYDGVIPYVSPAEDAVIPPLDATWDRQADGIAADSSDGSGYGAVERDRAGVSLTASDTTSDLIVDQNGRDSTDLDATSSGVEEMPIARAFAVGGLALLLVGIVLVQGRVMSEQARVAIDKADALLAQSATLRRAGNVSSIKALQAEITKTIQQLQATPAIPLLVPDGEVASEKRGQLEKEQLALQQRLKREEEATKLLAMSQQTAQAAVNILQDAPGSLSALTQSQRKWQQAIAELERVPKDTTAGKDAAQKLTLYRANLAEVQKQIDGLSRQRPRGVTRR